MNLAVFVNPACRTREERQLESPKFVRKLHAELAKRQEATKQKVHQWRLLLEGMK